MTRFKLGILQVNHDKSPEVGDCFPDDAHRFRDMLDKLEMRFDYRVYMTIGGEIPDDIDEQDGYLITGSPLSVLDETLVWREGLYQFIRRCDAAKKPLIGVCFGHQAVAAALGGQITKRQGGYNVGIESIGFTESYDYMTPSKADLSFYMFHEDEVSRLPEGCDLIASSAGCQIAAFVKEDHIFCLQAHPEFHDSFMRAVLDFSQPHMSDDLYQSAEKSLNQATDGHIFAQWMGAFLTKARD